MGLRLGSRPEYTEVYNAEDIQGKLPFVCVLVNTLDDVSPEELLSGPIRFSDGLHNDWGHAPAQIGHL